jgi:hypothetical protein
MPNHLLMHIFHVDYGTAILILEKNENDTT